MKQTWTKIVYKDTTTFEIDLDRSEWFWDDRPSADCKASKEEKALAKKQAAFYDTMTAAYNKQFENQQNVLKALQDVWNPILQAGPNQYGFNKEQDTALRTQATEGTAAEYAKAKQATNQAMSARGGGSEYLPSGVDDQIQGSIAASAASDQSSKNLAITNAGYEAGRQNFLNASNALNGVSTQYNPLGYSNAAIGAGDSAFSSAHQISLENSAWQGMLGGMIGSIGGAAVTGGFSSAFSPKIATKNG